MCKTYRKEWDDPWFDEMNPVMKLLYYESFRQDLEDQHEFARNYAILTGSFTNMELAQKMISEPTYESSEEDLDESTRMVLEGRKKAAEKKGRRRRDPKGPANEFRDVRLHASDRTRHCVERITSSCSRMAVSKRRARWMRCSNRARRCGKSGGEKVKRIA